MTNIARLFLAGGCLLPAACATPGGGSLGIVALDPNQHVSGAEPLLGTRGRECNAASLLAVFAPPPAADPVGTKIDLCTSYQRAIGWALKAHPNTGSNLSYSKEARNEVIGMLMAESDVKCDRYTQFIEQYNSNIQSGGGILTHAATTLAAIATGGTAQALSTGASIATNASGQITKGHFHEQTIPVIVAAYQVARTAVRQEVDQGMKSDVPDYAVSQGIRDAFRYHSNCSVVSGIRQASQAVQQQAVEQAKTDETTKGANGASGGGGNANTTDADADAGGGGNSGSGAKGNQGGRTGRR
jgi:hypothetical protein